MEVRRYRDPSRFKADARTVLLADPARNQLPLAILQTLIDHPAVYPMFHLWLAWADDGPEGLAMQTEPFNVLLGDPLRPGAVEALADAVVDDGYRLPGATGNRPWAERFVGRVLERTGWRAEETLAEGVFELTRVAQLPEPSGAPRPATLADRNLLRGWLRAFTDEALPPEHPREDDRAEQTLDLRLAGEGGGLWLWEDDGRPVSFSGYTQVPPIGSRIGPVYTPPEHRRNGYATGLVAALSAARLAAGDPACFLYTDLANPTSNAIYERIGYVPLCEAVVIVFRRETG